jgi:transketolase
METVGTLSFSEKELGTISAYLRWKAVDVCLTASNGHIGACCAASELFTALYFGDILRINLRDSKDPNRDVVAVRGHLGPLRYSIFNLLKWIEDDELQQYRVFGSRLQGHEDHLLTPGVDMGPNGSLGMLLSYGVGQALSKLHSGNPGRVFVFIGDGEEQEGNIAEAARHAATLEVSNLIAIVDKNGKQLSDPTAMTDRAVLAELWSSYGWNVITLKDGHNLIEIRESYRDAVATAEQTRRPTVIIAHTVKGYGLEGSEDHFSGYHTLSTVDKEVVQQSAMRLKRQFSENAYRKLKARLSSLKGFGSNTIVGKKEPEVESVPWPIFHIRPNLNTPAGPNHCQFDYFRELGSWVKDNRLQSSVYFLTADVTRHDHVDAIGISDFSHYYNVGIREQHSIGMAHGISLANPKARIIINSADAFAFRSIDQLLAAAQGGSKFVIIGDVSGLTNGKNGRTHQSAAQPIALRDLPGLLYLEPWDSVDMYNCLNYALSLNSGIMYIRVHNAVVPKFQDQLVQRPCNPGESFGQYVVYEQVDHPTDVVILASGPLVTEAIVAAQQLSLEGIRVRVVNAVSHSIDDHGFTLLGRGTLPILTAYNGLPETLAYSVGLHLTSQPGVYTPRLVAKGFKLGTTGDYQDLLKCFELDADSLAQACRNLATNRSK